MRLEKRNVKSIKVTFINDKKVTKISSGPKEDLQVLLGCGVKNYKKICKEHHENRLKGNHPDFNPILPLLHEDTFSSGSEVFFKPTALLDDEAQNNKPFGNGFGFGMPLRGSMLEKVDSAIKYGNNKDTPKVKKLSMSTHAPVRSTTPQTPKIKSTPVTPKTPTNKTTPRTPVSRKILRTPTSTCKTQKSLYRTPNCKGKENTTSIKDRCTTPETPYSFRRKVSSRIAEVIYEQDIEEYDEDEYDDSDMDNDYLPSDSEESFDETEDSKDINENLNPIKSCKSFYRSSAINTPIRTPRRGREPKVDVDMTATADDYFIHNSETNSCVTSDHTLNHLENPRLGPEALKSLLDGAYTSHIGERIELIEDHRTLFPHWMTLLREGFSIFLCGVGSKKQLLSLFQKDLLNNFDHLVINGFFPSLTLRSILTSIIDEVMDHETHPQGVNEQLALICSRYNRKTSDPLFLVIHNIDGPMLRTEKSQLILSHLAAASHIHVIASLDHVNSPLIFDGNKLSAYNPLWWDATTLAPYSEETSYENSLLVQQTGALALSSLIHVFRSLTPNAKGIFLILTRYQLDQKDNSTYAGLSFGELYQQCREKFLVNSDLTLRAQLTEFKDHKLLKTKKTFDGIENLIIPLDNSTLQEFLDQQNDPN